MSKQLINGLLLGVGLVSVGWLLGPSVEKMVNTYIDHAIEEHMAGIALNAPAPPEKTVPMLDGYNLNRQPEP